LLKDGSMFRELRIRPKLIAIFALPVVGMLLLASVRMVATVHDGLAADDEKQAIAFTSAVFSLAHELEAERDLEVVAAGDGPPTARAALDDQRGRVDRALVAWQAARAWGAARSNPRVRAALAVADARLARLGADRQALNGGTTRPPEALGDYTDTVERLLDTADATAVASTHRTLQQELSTAAALSRAKELTSLERGLVAGVLATGQFRTGDYQQLALAVGARDRELAHYRAAATPRQLDALAAALARPAVRRSAVLERAVLAARSPARLDIDPRAWWSTMSTRLDALRQLERQLGSDLAATNRGGIVAAEGQLLNDLLLLVIILVATFALAGFLARSMISPLTALQQAANDVAERRLPRVVQQLQQAQTVDIDAEAAPVAVGARDEIGQVAEAFNSVQRVAIQVATQQAALRRSVAELFVNLARRTQTLIGRQLQLIDELEQDETDPGRLDSLFRLDHLATQMRRNAENLIVLSSTNPVSRWSQPVALVNLVRSAIAEVEDYARVQVPRLHDVHLEGQVGLDIVHLLAELIENATRFSPPDTKVVITGQAAPHGYLLEIEDRGLGMSDRELAAANRRLADPSDLELPPGHMLGLFVVARLAARHGIKVQLRRSWYAGVSALVLLPAVLLAITTPAEAAWPPATLPAPPAQVQEREDAPHISLRPHPSTVSPGRQAPPPPTAPMAAPQPLPTAAPGEPDLHTATGLPRRTSQKHLSPQLASGPVPGPTAALGPAAPPPAGRSPETIRELLSSYQQGLQAGRAATATAARVGPEGAGPGQDGSAAQDSSD
jgi:signal transduction histidine kinase